MQFTFYDDNIGDYCFVRTHLSEGVIINVVVLLQITWGGAFHCCHKEDRSKTDHQWSALIFPPVRWYECTWQRKSFQVLQRHCNRREFITLSPLFSFRRVFEDTFSKINAENGVLAVWCNNCVGSVCHFFALRNWSDCLLAFCNDKSTSYL